MTAVFIFALVLLIAVLFSELARTTVLSTAVMFLVAGFICGQGVFGWMNIQSNDPVVGKLAELALVTVLFTDGLKLGVREIKSVWRLPGRALLLGLPLTVAVTALLGRYLGGLNWPQAFLVGAVLSPTDPVFASAIVERKQVPRRLRQLLNIESGVNDGLALPIVIGLLAFIGAREIGTTKLALEFAEGIAIGVAIPWLAIKLERTRWFSVSDKYQPLFALAIGMLVWTAATQIRANEFLAAFFAGVTIASVDERMRHGFNQFGEILTELFKLGALLVFGALISPSFVAEARWMDFVFAVVVLIVARPLALLPSFWGTRLNWQERLVASWFGPKGFSSVVFALIVLKANPPQAERIFHLVALVVAISMVAHSSSDVPISRWFQRKEAAAH